MTIEKDSLDVLYLEDSKQDIEIVHEKLKDNFDCPVLLDSAETKHGFLDHIEKKKYDVILADYTLPEFNAEEALKLAVSVCPDTPFICVSGTIGEDIAVELLHLGAADYVLKDRIGRLSFAICRAIRHNSDVIKRKEQEIYLQEMSARDRLILESINEGYGLFDREGIILDIGKSFAARFGKTVEECIGKKLEDFTPEDTYGDLPHSRMRLLREVFNTGKPAAFEDTRDGLWFNNRYCPVIKDGEVVAVSFFSSDITDKKKAEEEARKNAALRMEAEFLRAKEKEYLEILDGSTEASWIYDFKAQTLRYSVKWKERIGGGNIPDNEMSSYAQKQIHPDDLKAMVERREFSIKNKLPKFQCEYRIKATCGQYIWVYDQGKIIYDDNGLPLKIYGTSMDISDRKKAENALRESERRALALVAELEEADKNKNQFISVLSHELRNPLAAISAGIQVLDITQDINQAANVKDIINRQTNQLCNLVDDLLDITRISQNKIVLKKELINLNDIVECAAEDIISEYDKKNVKLEIKIQLEPVYLYVDPVRITQSIGNLLTNALKFTHKNGTVRLTSKTEMNNAMIIVEDDGIGISPEILPRLFRPFAQADNSLDRSNGGLGLGLSIVKGIVELHGGKAGAFSAGLGKGSTFTISLPISSKTGLESQAESVDSGGKTATLLIIEDNRDFADLLNTMLSEIGYFVSIASDGIEGLKLAKRIKPDVIICDIGLPGMNGYDVAQCIRNDHELKHINLIALTGYAGEGDAERIVNAGFNKYLTKPVDFTTLKRALK